MPIVAPTGQMKLATLLAAGTIVLSLLIHWPTVVSIVTIWAESSTFSHGFIVFPIALGLVWLCRKQLARLVPEPSLSGFSALALLSLLWLVAGYSNILVLQQFAVVAIIPALVWSLLGRRVVSRIKFPLFYLFFAVPAGEALIPYLMDFTAAFTAKAVQLSGIPIHRDGLFFSIPSGDFEVARTCSGVRYLIASLALGTLYAYLSYRSFRRRAAFVVLSIVVPILANGIRAYGIVMIAHFSNLRYATGVDHIIYGWLFFGVVMLLLFWGGSFFREEDYDAEEEALSTVLNQSSTASWKIPAAAIVAIALVGAGPVAEHYLANVAPADSSRLDLALPRGQNSWQGPEAVEGDWKPNLAGADLELSGRYQRDGNDVDAYVYYYLRQDQGLEMVNSRNQVFDRKQWTLIREDSDTVTLNDGKPLRVVATDIRIRSTGKKRLVWHWYNVSGWITDSRIGVKFFEVWAFLSGLDRYAYTVAMSYEYDDDDRILAENVLRSFMQDNFAVIEQCMAMGRKNGDRAAPCHAQAGR